MRLPTLALFTGDPAGIGPELVEKLLQEGGWREQAQVRLIAQQGALNAPADVPWHDWAGLKAAPFTRSQAQAPNGQFMLQGLAEGLRLLQSGQVQAFCFAPLNKTALRLGGM
ncbi:MAG: 4-hydroxythreonine-4-phosphate dehydrogenase PdxA, partial [Hylemonella sp.]